MSKQMQAAQQANSASDLRKSSSAGSPAETASGALKAQMVFARLASAAIVGAALVLTYEGTMKFCQRHGAQGWRGAVIAGMNDLAVMVGILWPQRVLQGIAGLCSVFTIWANLDHASDGVAGLAVALIPPVLAILMVAALEHVFRMSQPEPADEPMSQVLSLEVAHCAGMIRPTGSLTTQVIRAESVDEPMSREDALMWIEMSPAEPTCAEVMAHCGVSKAQANRYRKEIRDRRAEAILDE